jgi:hypothetical protein
MTLRHAWLQAAVIALGTAPAAAQGYRVQVDARAQAVSFRGLTADSIPEALTVVGPSGGFETPDGYAARCGLGAYCFFYRPGPELRAVPVTTSASFIAWGFGIPGLTVRATGRLVADVGPDDVWPGTDPAGQFLEGYVEYQRPTFMARAGRLMLASRLESYGFDGAWLKYRWEGASLEFTGYGGWGLGRAAALPVTSPALNPLDEWRPQERQVVAGLEAAWLYRDVEVRGEYRRELDQRDWSFVSERAALSFGVPVWRLPVRVTGGLEYNVAEGLLGSADVRFMYAQPRYALSAGVRRYRPWFSLWTLWSAFSPVPHNGVTASAEFRATSQLSLRARGEAYQYEDAGVSTSVVPATEDDGWRVSAGATFTLSPQWAIDANAGAEHGPGAAGRFGDVAVTWLPDDRYALHVYGGALERPLEFRFYDAASWWTGGRAEFALSGQQRVWADVTYVDDQRDREDAAAWSLDQVRFRAGLTISFGSSVDQVPLPPARSAR